MANTVSEGRARRTEFASFVYDPSGQVNGEQGRAHFGCITALVDSERDTIGLRTSIPRRGFAPWTDASRSRNRQ